MSNNKPLLVRFKVSSSMLGASREDLKQCADRLGVTETAAVHVAINRLHTELFPEQIAQDAPTDAQIAKVNAKNAETDKDPVVRRASLADVLGC